MSRLDWWHFLVERHLDRMVAIVRELDEGLLNASPDLPGANSPFQIVFHCCGMTEWWTREAVLSHDVGRDRDAEFGASGSLEELLARVEQVRTQLRADLDVIDIDMTVREDPTDGRDGAIRKSAGDVLLHVLEELAQHHGHLELTRDLLRAAGQRAG